MFGNVCKQTFHISHVRIYEKVKGVLMHFHAFCLHFLRMHHDIFYGRGFESLRAQFLSAEIVLFVIYLFNHDSPKPAFFMLNIAFMIWRSLKYSFCLNWNLRFLQYEDYKNILLFTLCFDRHVFYKNLIVLHHGDNNFLFWHLHQIYTFNNNLDNEGLITSHLMCVTSLW